MTENNNSAKKLTLEERTRLEREMEESMLIQEANNNRECSLDFGSDGEAEIRSELTDVLLSTIDNPEEKYHLYYKVIDNIMRKHLPKGKEHEEHRKLIYEEKNTFLTRGHRLGSNGVRGADSRQGYTEDMQELVSIVAAWLTSGANMFDLYIRLRDANKAKGYPME